MPSNSIRFAFPEHPNLTDHQPFRPRRTATINSLATSISSFKNNKDQHTLAIFPFFVASFFSVLSTFLHVRATVVNGYIVDHANWNGLGHFYDQYPVVYLNTIESILMTISLCCGIMICLVLVMKTRMSYESTRICLFLAAIHAFSTLATSIFFRQRTHDLLQKHDKYVYSRGYYSCLGSATSMTLAMLGFFWNWILDLPTASSLSTTLTTMLLPTVMYCSTLVIGTLAFMWIEQWEYTQAMIFCATALTTIGYGDVTPITSTGRLFFLGYASIGICVVGYFMLSLRSAMISGSSSNLIMKVNLMRVESLHDLALQQRIHNQKDHDGKQHDTIPGTDYDSPFDTTTTIASSSFYNTIGNNNDSILKHHHRRQLSSGGISSCGNYTLGNLLKEQDRQMWVHVVTPSGAWRMSIIFALSWFGGAAVFCTLEDDWSYLDALYFAFVTQLTIGFGDLVPQTALAQEFWFLYIVISIAVAAYFISLFGDVLATKLLRGGDDKDDDADGKNPYKSKFDIESENLYDGNDDNGCISLPVSNARMEDQLTLNLNQDNIASETPSTTTHYSRQLEQHRFVHQPLKYRTYSLPNTPLMYQKRNRYSYGSVVQQKQHPICDTSSSNKKTNTQWFKSSKYLPVAIYRTNLQ
ncbi:uncharacterized protein BX664DRAFT_352512 [Halteromyces radiatus]|uniref:uncharacterized protein n=1 Tax=Halteromyces radiatus TaxID=101107 RepID=UPI0022201EB7|nr:uncharacterized protein BX664DRAFT_352512 [Halteromyces radiatus]KAI8081359.1 hypothetical protein BX664DRAFT_352512 [Halteromyces radiatus]